MNVTPLFRQYLQLKEKAKDAILLFRVGDFYETYFEDAKIFSQINSVVLTKRTLPDGKNVPMAGVPFHSVDNYIKNLLNAGYKVAIAEQMEEPSKGNLVKRDIIELITPGTIVSYNYLDEKSFNFLMIVDYKKSSFYILVVDVSVSEGYILTSNKDNFLNIVKYFNPSEIIFTSNIDKTILNDISSNYTFFQAKKNDDLNSLREYLLDENSFFLLEKNDFLDVFNILTKYLESNIIFRENKLKFKFKAFSNDFILLDGYTLKNLDIVGSKSCLVNTLDYTSTSFGSRLFKIFLTQPLKNIELINKRLDAVEYFVNNTHYVIELREKLKKLNDIERVISKFSLYKYILKDLIYVRKFFENVLSISQYLSNFLDPPDLVSNIINNINNLTSTLSDLINLLLSAVNDEIIDFEHFSLIIKENFNQELDQYIYILRNNKKWLDDYQDFLRQKLGIKSLKIGFNQIFGYYIEVSKSNLSLVPDYFERRQTLTNAERFVTDDLKNFESKLAQAVDKINEIQSKVIKDIIYQINEKRLLIKELIENIALLDIILSLAHCAIVNNYIKPTIVNEKVLILDQARHPIYEKYFEYFVPNNISLNSEKFFMILTGPNMGGKSTFLKTVALNVLLAHVGSFVPCSKAVIGLTDGIFTRIGSSDDIINNRSTFMVEMLESAYIVNNCTENSFIVMDEIGRGTSTYDGMAIAWAICQYLSTKVKCRTILSTHFHQLSNLEKIIDSIINCSMEVLEEGSNIKFTYKVVNKPSEKSYGLFVAKIAGLKPEVINIAKEVLDNFEKFTGIKKVQTKLIT